MSKIIVRHIGTAQWYLQNEGPEKRIIQKRKNPLENAFFAVKRSILLRFVNFKNWHMQIYQTKPTICLKLIWDL